MSTNVNYTGIVPPKMCGVVAYKLVPKFAGSGGGGIPVTPVPVAVVLHDGMVGLAYSETISAQGGTGSYTFSVLGGALPSSTSLTTSTGVISGTPTVAGTYSFTIQVTDSLGNTGSQSFSITVSAAAASGGAFTFLT